jgi:hypothetical protein
MNRRAFLRMLASVPLLGRLIPAPPVEALCRQTLIATGDGIGLRFHPDAFAFVMRDRALEPEERRITAEMSRGYGPASRLPQ